MLKHCKGTQKDSGMHIWPSAFDCWHMFQNIFLRMLRNQEHAPVLKEPFLRSSTMRNLPKLLDLLIVCKYSLNFSSFRLKFPASDLFDKKLVKCVKTFCGICYERHSNVSDGSSQISEIFKGIKSRYYQNYWSRIWKGIFL